jgi:2-polyprenyl-3-methyl-5-hydroxy-6-metoxy-1,4-benzoquinol methylase
MGVRPWPHQAHADPDQVGKQRAMHFDPSVEPFLTGARFDNGLRVSIARPEPHLPTRIDYLLQQAQGKQVIHVGCVDHLPLIPQKIQRGTWLHRRLVEQAARCIGIDVHEEGLAYVREQLGYPDVLRCDLIADPVPAEIAAQRWDLMVLGELLEHIDNPVLFLEAIRTRYAGYVDELVISVPNAFRFENFFAAMRHTEHINTDHRYWFTPYTLAKVVLQAGMRVVSFQFCQGYRLSPLLLHKHLLLRACPAGRDTLVMTARLV